MSDPASGAPKGPRPEDLTPKRLLAKYTPRGARREKRWGRSGSTLRLRGRPPKGTTPDSLARHPPPKRREPVHEHRAPIRPRHPKVPRSRDTTLPRRPDRHLPKQVRRATRPGPKHHAPQRRPEGTRRIPWPSRRASRQAVAPELERRGGRPSRSPKATSRSRVRRPPHPKARPAPVSFVRSRPPRSRRVAPTTLDGCVRTVSTTQAAPTPLHPGRWTVSSSVQESLTLRVELPAESPRTSGGKPPVARRSLDRRACARPTPRGPPDRHPPHRPSEPGRV